MRSTIISFLSSKKFFLATLAVVFSILRVPSLIEPAWYGDEGIYQVIGVALRAGRLLYSEIWDNKPPFLYLVYALVNSDLFYVKLLSLLAGVGAIIAFYQLTEELFSRVFPRYIAIIVFSLLLGLPVLEGNIANAENFIHLPLILGVLYAIRFTKSQVPRNLIISGMLLSVALMFKIVVIFDIAAIVIFLLLLNKDTLEQKLSKRVFIKKTKTLKTFGITILGIPSVIALFFLVRGAFPEFIQSVFIHNVSYVGVENNLVFPMGFLLLKLILLCLAVYVTIKYRNMLGFFMTFLCLWLSFSLFSVFFSERPYTHYLLMGLPVFSLLVGSVFIQEALYKLKIAVIVGVVILTTIGFDYYRKIDSYYTNYVSFLTGDKTLSEYQSFFDRNTPTYYALSDFIESHTGRADSIFFWGDSGQVYYLAHKLPPGRFIVSYHVIFVPGALSETKEAVAKTKPKYAIALRSDRQFHEIITGYQLKYTIEGAEVYERQR